MIQTGFETRVKVQEIIDSQLPEFILDESPKAAEFLKQYYISQEYQGGPVDIAENLDQYLKLDNLIPEVVVGYTGLSTNISSSVGIITVTSTKGFPPSYGLLKIDNEVITYTGITTNTFTGCIRGFSGITDYHDDLKYEELVFSDSSAASHSSGAQVQNLSSLFLQEFYKKIKFSLTPGLDGYDFDENLNVGNFIKEARNLYESKGTVESFRILFNVLFGETPTVIDTEKFLLKPSDAGYIRRNVAVVDLISGDITKLEGQTITKTGDPKTTASVSEVESITRNNKTYYKLNFFIGYDDTYPNVTGNFSITPSTKVVDNVTVTPLNSANTVITVDSTIGFPESGNIFYGKSKIFYSQKTINQFLGCYVEGSQSINIEKTSTLISNETYYGYENGDESKKVEFRITGVLSNIEVDNSNYIFKSQDKVYPQNLGELIPNGKSTKEIFANTWIYNTSSRYQLEEFVGFTLITKSEIDSSSLSIGDTIEILDRNTEIVVTGFENAVIRNITNKNIEIDINTTPSGNTNTPRLISTQEYDIRRLVKKASSSIVPIEFGNNKITSDIQNIYVERPDYLYVATNSLPSYSIDVNIFEYQVNGLTEFDDQNEVYAALRFNQIVSFITGDKVFYSAGDTPIQGLQSGIYYVEVLGDKQSVKLYLSQTTVGSSDYLTFGNLSEGIVSQNHKVRLYTQRSGIISPQKVLKKFKLNPEIGKNEKYLTSPGSVGMLKNGVEIYSYKTNDKIYYGPIDSVEVFNGGSGFDVINPPLLNFSYGSAKIQPVVTGSVEKVYVDPQDFDIDVLVSVALTGGNGSGAVFEPVIQKYRREIEFDARSITDGGGLDIDNERISFASTHNLVNGQPIIYDSNNHSEIGIGSFKGSNINQLKNLVDGATYYTKVISDKVIEIYQNYSDYLSGINTVGFTTVGNFGIQKFKTEVKNKLTGIKVINGGNNYTNRKLILSSQNINVEDDSFYFKNHGFSNGDYVKYEYENSAISGLSTSTTYQILNIDSDRFRLCDAGVSGNNPTNYQKKNYVRISSVGSGYQILKYPNIQLSVEYTAVGSENTEFKGSLVATPIIRGKISQVYVYEKGSDYGSTVLNVHERPQISIKNGKEAQLKPIIVNGRIIDVRVLFGGSEYYSTPDIVVSGRGSGATIRPVLSNNKIVDAVIIDSGFGYDISDTIISVIPAGRNAVFNTNVRSLTLNNSYKYGLQKGSYRDPASEILVDTENNLEYAIVGYSQKIKENINDTSSLQGRHSDIIGWAYDGNPIYGPFGYSDPNNISSSIKKIQPSYSAANIENRPSSQIFPEGYFIEDYIYTGDGDLDQYNGRFGKTKDFPEGVYAYFATVDVNPDGSIVGKFPYFIGDQYRSPNLNENTTLNQSFDFNNSKLLRNTSPYKVNDPYAGNDFLIESNEIIEQKTLIESVSSGSVTGLEIVKPGTNYSVGDEILFDNSNTDGGGIFAKVSEITGKEITQVSTTVETYSNSPLVWEGGERVRVYVNPHHNFVNGDNISISGLSTQVSNLNGNYKIGVTTYSTVLDRAIPNYSTTGIVTDIYLTSIPNNVSAGSSIKINSEVFSVISTYPQFNIIKVSRSTSGVAHSQTSIVNFLPDSFTINKPIDYFDSKLNLKTFFNPTKSIGIGTIVGVGTDITYNIGITTFNVFVPTQSIFLPNHQFNTGQRVILRRKSSDAPIAVTKTPDSLSFNILGAESETLYVINKSKDYIGIVTNVGLTTDSNGLFFLSSGSNTFNYSIEPNYPQVTAAVNKIKTVVSVSDNHGLKIGDNVKLSIKPNTSVGIGTSTSVKVKLDNSTKKIIFDPITFNSSGINTSTNSITIQSHKFNTGDKVLYETTGTLPSGLSQRGYFVYKVDSNTLKLCETYIDSLSSPPVVVDISSVGSGTHQLSVVNPQIKAIKNNNVVFDLSDVSLRGYEFKIYYDGEFEKEFVSIATTSSGESLSVIGIGSAGFSANASLTLNYKDNVPTKLYYNLEKSGYISTSDFDVVNHNEIIFSDSLYNQTYSVDSITNQSFTISPSSIPESLSYIRSECDELKYSTTSTNSLGGIDKINLLSGGYAYKSLPIFTGVNSKLGSGAFIIPVSTTIGKINQSRIINEGFEYSSDKTLRPTASISKTLYVSSSNTIDTIDIIDGGQNYTTAPNLVVVDSDTGELINSGLLRANIVGSSIRTVTIDDNPKGLPIKPVTIRSINNSNGISIEKVEYLSANIVTCTLTTPIAGFSTFPFAIGDRVFVEGIEKVGSEGDGFNSSDYGYTFFTVTNYFNTSPDKVEFSIEGLTDNPGTPKLIQDSYASIVNFKNYPKFSVTQKFSPFISGERLLSDKNDGNGFVLRDLSIVDYDENILRVSGSYILSKNERVKGQSSSSEAVIETLDKTNAFYNVNSFNTQNFGWKFDTGKLNEDYQVTPDNDYYQNLSYSVKSNKTWEEIVTPVNSLLHTSGMKNFADTQIMQNAQSGIASTSRESTISFINVYTSDNRVDTINNLDTVRDVDVLGNNSKFIEFDNLKLTGYILCKTNRVLKIDDISSQFSSENDQRENVANILPINVANGYNKFLVQVKDIFTNEVQFSEIITINNDTDIFTLNKASITSSGENEILTDIRGYVDEDLNFYLRLEPENPYDSNFDIKILQESITSRSGIGSIQSVGFVDLISRNRIVPSQGMSSIIEVDSSKYSSIHSSIHLSNSNSSKMNYVEIYLTHDGNNAYISEYYFDDNGGQSSLYLGEFIPSIQNGTLSLKYSNTTSETITLRSKNVGFGSTSIGSDFYRFKLPGQINSNERTVVFESKYENISSGSTSILVLDKSLFTSAKSLVRIGYGQTSSLHQIMTVYDGNDVSSVQYPYLSIGSTLGIGSFESKISGNNFVVDFHPDPSVSGQLEILSFNECLYTKLDFENTPPDLVYSPVTQSVKLANYYGINSPFVNKLDFEANYEGTPIFMKTFDPGDSNVVNLETGVFTIPNHFFSSGEELIYTPRSTFIGIGTSAMGIGATANYVGVVTTLLPEVVYAIKDTNNTFRIATRKEYAEQGIGVTFTSVGLGNAHQLEMSKKNEKSLITINNFAQYPISYTYINHNLSGNGGQIGLGVTVFALSGISSINPTDILKIDDEYMRIENVGFGTTSVGPITFTGNVPLVEVTRGFSGSEEDIHTDSTLARVYRGSYNIAKNKIYFTQPPRGNSLDLIGPDERNLARERATFTGRVFLRQDYTSNQLYDDISDQFTGIGQTFTLTTQGINTVGLGTTGGNGIVFINNVFQSPTTLNNSGNNYIINENLNSGITSITFTGITSEGFDDILYTSEYDINQNQLPRGGIIVSYGSTPGLGYAPLVGASVTAVVSGGSIISVGLGEDDILGSGYRNPVSVAVTETGHSGNPAVITASAGPGGELSFTVVDGGSGYSNPTINVSAPSYENLPVVGVSRLGIGQTTDTGIGLLLNVEIGASSTTGIGSTLFEVKSFKITRNGYGFRRGDVLKPVGLVTAKNLDSPLNDFEITVLDTFTDSFAAWQFGELDYIDSIKNFQNGRRTRFPLFYNSQLLSFEVDEDNPDSQLIDLDSILLIFVNGIPQQPGVSYQFTGGASFRFTVPPKPEDDIAIFFYRGTRGQDTEQVTVNETIKSGDTVQIFSNNSISNTITQNKRVVYSIVGSDEIETELYNSQGIDELNKKPIYWSKQKSDLILNGDVISKSRDSLETQIYPTANIISGFTTTSTEIFVNDASLFNYENESPIKFDAIIAPTLPYPVSAAVTATVSSSGTISSLIINNPGSGYIGSEVTVSISLPPSVGVGIGTRASATISIVDGSLSTVSITNPGFGYTTSIIPQVLVPSPGPVYEVIRNISNVDGFNASVVGIATTTGIGAPLAIKFTLSRDPFTFPDIQVGYPVYISQTTVGNGVTSIDTTDSNIVSISTSYLDNIYKVHAFNPITGIMTCNVSSDASIVGIATTGTLGYPVGRLSWGRLSGFTRSSSPISIALTEYTSSIGISSDGYNVGLSTYPIIQRRGFGLRSNGALKKE